MPPRRPHSPPSEPNLFEPEADPSGGNRRVVAVAQAAGVALTKAQQTFNRLIDKIRRLREELAMWQAYEDKHRRFVAEKILPLHGQIRAAKIDLLRLADRLLGDAQSPRLGKVQRRKLRGLLRTVADDVLGDAPDAEVEAIHDRHAGERWQDRQAAELAEAEALFGAMLGEDAVKGHDAKTFDDFARHMAGKMAEQADDEDRQREQERAAGRAGKRAAAAAERQAQAQREASQSVREVYRKLASALHPDREPDAAERGRKTRLMQQANEAYGRDDLLALLTLQLELDHIDEAHLAGLPDARITLYNRVLRDQVRALEQEIEEVKLPLRRSANLSPFDKLKNPAWVEFALHRDLADMQRLLRDIRADTEALADPQRRSASIAGMPESFDNDGGEIEAMLLNLGSMAAPGPGRRPRRRR
jgi:hypothetical protein